MEIKVHTVFDGVAGWKNGSLIYRLAVGGNLTETADGTLLCTWLSGTGHEPATDNSVLIARSRDGGHTWSEPAVWVPAAEEAGAGSIVPWPMPDGQLVAFCARWPSEHQYTVWHYFRMHSDDNGFTWKDDGPLELSPAHNVSLASPVRRPDGSFLFAASTFDRRESPLAGPVGQLIHAETEEEAAAIPVVAGERTGGKFSTHLHGCCVFRADAELRSFERLGSVRNRPLGLLEPTLMPLQDGRLVLLMRAEFDGFLWRSESTDGGRTFSPAYRTDIKNPSSLTHMIRLPDGRIALLHNPTGEPGRMSPRDRLSLWISDDELQSWKVKEDLITGGMLSYPNALIRRDGTLVFGYDHNRNQVRFVEVFI